MSPLEDDLRTALTSRTSALTPSPELFAGVERRARRMRRRRGAATVAGSALAVTALGLGGPLLVTSLTSASDGPVDVATSGPSEPPQAVQDEYGLDPDAPWPYRGVPLGELGEGFLETAQREWQVRRPGSDLRPLFGQLDGPSETAQLVFVAVGARGSSDPVRWGVVRSSEAGPEFVYDDAFTPIQRYGLAAALPGDEGARLLVVAAPGTSVEYAAAAQPLGPTTPLADGVAVTPLDSDLVGDSYAVRAPDGSLLTQLGAPDPAAVEPGAEGGPPGDEVPPSNAVDWPVRGGAAAELVERALNEFARQRGRSREEVGGRLLYGFAPPDREREYVMLHVWSDGDARTVGASFRQRSAMLDSMTTSGPTVSGQAVLAALFPPLLSGTRQQLLIVPGPGAGRVLYSPDGSTPPEPVPDQGTGTAVLVERDSTVSGDRVLVLDGDSSSDRPLFDGTVEDLLASMR